MTQLQYNAYRIGVAPEWSIPLMPGMHRSGPRQGRRRVAAAEEAEPGL